VNRKSKANNLIESDMKIKLLLIVFFLLLSSISWADEYVLVMSKDDNVCQYMHKLYNEDLKKYGEIKYDKHKEYDAIKWDNKKYYRMRDGKKEYPIQPYESNTTVLISRFDINNDGKEETVIKHESYYKNILSDHLHYFKTEDASLFKEDAFDIAILYNKATGSIGNGSRYTYVLKELPQFIYLGVGDKEAKAYYSLGKYIYIHPFFFAGTYYLGINDEVPFDIKRIYSGKFLVILKYTKDNQIKDTCYFLKVSDCRKNISKDSK
jgi:hypothetical protein